MRVAAIGDNCIDLYLRLNRFYVTGNVVDFAVNLQKLGVPVSLVTTTGNDAYGRITADTLKKTGVDISHLKIGEGPTAISYMELNGNERVHGEYAEGVMEHVVFSDEDIAFAGSHDLVHSAFLGRADRYLEKIKKFGARISFDYSNDLNGELVERTIPFVDYPFFSYKKRDAFIEDYLRDKVRNGAKAAVATLGENGSLAYDGKSFCEYGVVETNVVNTIGAGDSFIAGFVYGLTKGMDIAGCLKQGAVIAAEVISVFGPWKEETEYGKG